jgi:hypothetical protein
MMWSRLSRPWRNRLFIAAFIGSVSYVLALLLRFGPRPVPFVVMMAIVLSLMWLALDISDADPAPWVPSLPVVSDRSDQATSDLRILSGHQQASVPTEALRDRLVALARGRDPDLAAQLRAELDPVRRLSPAEIDRILTRIEEARDRT